MLQLFSDNLHIYRELGLLVVFSLLLRQAIIFNSQSWVRSFSSSLTLILLPIVTYSITKVISGNIALSLGLVGALSIVRFRNPVRSSFELSVLFLFISLGIIASVNMGYLVMLGSVSMVVLFGTGLLTRLYKKSTGENFFALSFSEASYTGTLEVETSKQHPELEKETAFVTGISNYETTLFNYRFASDNFAELKDLKSRIEQFDGIKSINISQV